MKSSEDMLVFTCYKYAKIWLIRLIGFYDKQILSMHLVMNGCSLSSFTSLNEVNFLQTFKEFWFGKSLNENVRRLFLLSNAEDDWLCVAVEWH